MIITNYVLMHKDYYEDWLRIKKDLYLILQGLEVKEKCERCGDLKRTDPLVDLCPDCKGSGTITRPITAEEVREFIAWAFERNRMFEEVDRLTRCHLASNQEQS